MEIRPDQSVKLNANFEGETYEFLLDPKYDRVDRFARLGFNLLKIVDSERGFVQMPLEDEMAALVSVQAQLPVVEREFITESEYDLYLRWREAQIDDSWLDA